MNHETQVQLEGWCHSDPGATHLSPLIGSVGLVKTQPSPVELGLLGATQCLVDLGLQV